MPEVEVTLPDETYSEIRRFVDQGEFLNEDQAYEELISLGLSTYDTGEESTRPEGEDIMADAFEDQRDPALRDDEEGDDYRF